MLREKDIILKAKKEKGHIIYKYTPKRFRANFPSETIKNKGNEMVISQGSPE